MERTARFQVYKDDLGEYRWRLRAENNKIIADSAEGYHNKEDCMHGIHLVRDIAPEVDIENLC